MQNKCETQFKIQNNTFSKIKLYFWRKIRKSTKGIEKNQVDISIRRFFWFENVEKHEIGGAKGDKKKEKKQFEPDGTWNKKKHVFEKKKNKRKERNTKRT